MRETDGMGFGLLILCAGIVACIYGVISRGNLPSHERNNAGWNVPVLMGLLWIVGGVLLMATA